MEAAHTVKTFLSLSRGHRLQVIQLEGRIAALSHQRPSDARRTGYLHHHHAVVFIQNLRWQGHRHRAVVPSDLKFPGWLPQRVGPYALIVQPGNSQQGICRPTENMEVNLLTFDRTTSPGKFIKGAGRGSVDAFSVLPHPRSHFLERRHARGRNRAVRHGPDVEQIVAHLTY